RNEIEQRADEWSSALGDHYRGENSGWEAAEALADWLVRLEELTAGSLPGELRSALLADERRWPDFAGVRTAHAEFASAADAVAELFDTGAVEALLRSPQTTLDALR